MNDPATPPSSPPKRHVVVIGGGVSGLSAAYRLVEIAPELQVTLLESRDRLGGTINTLHADGFLIEESADNYLTQPSTVLDLADRLGMRDELISTNPAHRKAFVVFRGKMYPVPPGFTLMAPGKLWPILTTPLLSWRGKLRLAWERFVPTRGENEAEESLTQFATRRLGSEVFERIVQPLVAGIYSADPDKLSVAATLPRFIEMEQGHGSLTRGAAAKARQRQQAGSGEESGARYGMFVTPRAGGSTLINAMASRLPEDAVRLAAQVESVEKTDTGWRLRLDGDQVAIECDGLIVATAAHPAARLLDAVDPAASGLLGGIPHASCSIVCLGYPEEQLSRPLEGSGVVVPEAEGRPILAASFSSNKFPDRAPSGHALIRVFIGGAKQGDLVDLPDEELIRIAREQLADLVGVQGEPVKAIVVRWRAAMPQYHLGHREIVAQIEGHIAEHDGLEIANNALRGVGVPQCIAEGERAAEAILDSLNVL